MSAEFKDYRIQVKAALNSITIAWLHETANDIASNAKRNCQLDGDAGVQLRRDYKADVNEGAGEAKIGSSLEAAYWEEFGTGSHARGAKKGRPGWWVYTPGSRGGRGYKSITCASQKDAENLAKYIKKKYKKTAIATNGREPSYTLQNAFEAEKNPAIAELKKRLKEGMN